MYLLYPVSLPVDLIDTWLGLLVLEIINQYNSPLNYGVPMAVQKNKKTRSKRDMRRSHDYLRPPAISSDFVTGTEHLRHHISSDGFYRGREIIPQKVSETENDEAE